MFERYNLQERLTQQYITQEDFQPFDAHQAKSMLTKNNFLAQLMCLYGLQEFILFSSSSPHGQRDKRTDLVHQEGNPAGEVNQKSQQQEPDWVAIRRNKELMAIQNTSYDTQMFIKYSFIKNFKMNRMQIEPFKAPKILGDVFEAIIGAVFKDGGILKLNQVLKELMAPFVLYVAKYSKSINKEPKEDFQQLATQLKMKPFFRSSKDPIEVHLSEVLGSQLGRNHDATAKLMKVEIIHNNGQVMTTSYGNSLSQAEKNASILGIEWLHRNKKDEINKLLQSSLFCQSLKACFMQHGSAAERFQ